MRGGQTGGYLDRQKRANGDGNNASKIERGTKIRAMMGAEKEDEAREAAQQARYTEQTEAKKRNVYWFRHPDPVAKFTGWVAVYTLVLAFATIGSAYILYKTDETLTHTLVANQRPWVSIAVMPLYPIEFAVKNRASRLTVFVKNLGLSPAVDIAAYGVILFRYARPSTALEAQKERCAPAGVAGLAPNQGQGFPSEDRTENIQVEIDEYGRPDGPQTCPS